VVYVDAMCGILRRCGFESEHHFHSEPGAWEMCIDELYLGLSELPSARWKGFLSNGA
jgi:hypothetical protein